MTDILNVSDRPPCLELHREESTTGSRRSLSWSLLMTIAFVALLLRIATSFTRSDSYPHPLYFDEGIYRQLAFSLVDHGTFDYPQGNPEVHRAPLYPLFIATVISLIGENVPIILLLQGIMGVAVVVLLSRCVSNHLRHNHRITQTASIATAVALALSPIALIYERRMMGEAVVTLPLVLGIVLWIAARSSPQKKSAFGVSLAAGCALGLAILAKPALMLLPPFLMCLHCLTSRKQRFRQRLLQGSVLVLGAVIAVSPWTIRNFNVTGKVIPVAVGGGKRLFLATVPRQQVRKVESEVVGPLYEGANPDGVLTFEQKLTADRKLKKLAVSAIAGDPVNYLRLCADRTIRMWANSHTSSVVGSLNADTVPRPIRLGAAVVAVLTILLALTGVVFCLRNRQEVLTPLWTTPLYVALIHAPLEGGGRYVVPAWPFVICMAAIAIGHLHHRKQKSLPLPDTHEITPTNSVAA